MRSMLFAIGLLAAVPAQAAIYEFAGSCAQREFTGADTVPIPCGADTRIILKTGAQHGGFEFTIYDDVFGGDAGYWRTNGANEGGSATLWLGEPYVLYLLTDAGHFRLDPGGSWTFFHEYEAHSATWYALSGINGALQQVPLPGTILLLSLGAFVLHRFWQTSRT